ncbi:MAG: SDR family NAD(P)-dependent oxidoreductase [Armatimonadetes bacterium]|nr:SDR family NAD(P)-dependent oxidoreductase [Armatimonadota bacterium]
MIVGASDGIGAATARLLAAQGCAVALVARREAELETVAGDIRATGGTALTYPHDVSDFDAVPALFQTVCRDLGGLDLIVYAAGAMPRLAPNEYDFAKDRAMICVNLLGAVAWLNEAAARFAATNAGTIVGIGSVAGDRGRRAAPVYGATKAALETYLESLRNRAGGTAVRVVTIKPGPIDTAMTKGMDKLPLLLPVSEAARQIVKAAGGGAEVVYVPGAWAIIMAVIRAVPSALFRKLNI